MASPAYPFEPRSTATLIPGQFWAVPLKDGRFACARVLQVAPKSRTSFLVGLMDWVGDRPPEGAELSGKEIVEAGQVHLETLRRTGRHILGHRPLEADGLALPEFRSQSSRRGCLLMRGLDRIRAITDAEWKRLPVFSYWGPGVLQAEADQRFVEGKIPPPEDPDDYPFFRQIRSPLTPDQLRPLDPRCERVQFCADDSPLPSPAEFERLAGFLRGYPDVALRVYGHRGMPDLEFLRAFPFLRRFDVGVWQLDDAAGLRHLSGDLVQLSIGQTKRRLRPLRWLERFPALEELFIEGHSDDADLIGTRSRLRDLRLRSVTLPGLSMLAALPELRSLDLKLGGTRNLDVLPALKKLRYLELWAVRGLSDLSPVSEAEPLQYLFLQDLPRVRELPPLGRLKRLRRLHLEGMKGVRELRPILKASGLEELVVVNAPHLEPEDAAPLRKHPSLRRATIGLGSLRKNRAVEELLGLPPVDGGKGDFRFE